MEQGRVNVAQVGGGGPEGSRCSSHIKGLVGTGQGKEQLPTHRAQDPSPVKSSVVFFLHLFIQEVQASTVG